MQQNYLSFPNLSEVEAATQFQLCRWYRFLPVAKNTVEVKIIDTVIEKVKANGGMTPELSKEIGWEL